MHLLLALIAVVALGAGVFLLIPDSGKGIDPVEQSLLHIRQQYAAPENAKATTKAPSTSRSLEQRLSRLGARLTSQAQTEKFRAKLDSAGHPVGWDVDRLLAAKMAGLAAGSTLGLLIGLAYGGPVFALIGAAMTGVLGSFAPNMVLYQKAYNRNEEIQSELADALDLMTICMEAGQSFPAAMAQVAKSNKDSALGREFARAIEEINMGNQQSALTALSERSGNEDVQRFAAAMAASLRMGNSAGQALSTQAGEMRLRRRQAAEEKAQKVAVKMTGPLIGLILPSVFIVIMGPAAVSIVQMMS